MLDLQRVHGLLEVRGGTLDLDAVADREGTVREPDRGHADFPEEVEDFSDLLPFHLHANRLHAINMSRSRDSTRERRRGDEKS
jgi:hypothetical protein